MHGSWVRRARGDHVCLQRTYANATEHEKNEYSLPATGSSNGMTIRDMVPLMMPEGAEDNTALFARGDAHLASLSDVTGGRLYRARAGTRASRVPGGF